MLQTEVTIEFIICGPNFNPSSVTKLLGISPKKYTIRGSMKNCKYSPAIETTWCLQHCINSLNDLDYQVRQIIEKRSDIYLKKNTLDFIADLGGKLTIDIEFW